MIFIIFHMQLNETQQAWNCADSVPQGLWLLCKQLNEVEKLCGNGARQLWPPWASVSKRDNCSRWPLSTAALFFATWSEWDNDKQAILKIYILISIINKKFYSLT